MMAPEADAKTPHGMLRLAPATDRDEALWLALRNEPEAVKWSRNAKPITPLRHHDWFAASLAMPTRKLFLAWLTPPDGQPICVGIGRLDRRTTGTEFSLVVAPAWRNKAFGPKIVMMLVHQTHLLRWPRPCAIVHGRNRRSLRLFLRCGFAIKQRRWIEFEYHDPKPPRRKRL